VKGEKTFLNIFAAVKNIDIDIADILVTKISVNIDIGKGDIDPTLVCRLGKLVKDYRSSNLLIYFKYKKGKGTNQLKLQ